MTHALIDGDLIAFPIAAALQGGPEYMAIQRCNELVESILSATSPDSFAIYLTGSGNFRKSIDPLYKANRTKPMPEHLMVLREFLVINWDAEIVNGYEADDALGMANGEDTIICTLDKDMKQLPGNHYNWKQDKKFVVTPDEGIKHFYASSLIGDVADNIIGITGIGPVKSEKLLANNDPIDYYEICRRIYRDDERYHRNLSLLWIWRKMNDQEGWKSCMGGLV